MPELKKLRQEIDKIDKKLLKILAERFALTNEVGRYKKKHKLGVCDSQREKEMFKKRNLWAKKFNLDQNLVKEIFKLIIKTTRRKHKKIFENEK